MSDIDNLIDKLSQVDMEIISKPGKKEIFEFLEGFLGPSIHAKRKERQRIKILQNKKVMLINAHPVPSTGKELTALANLALSSYNTAELNNEKEAWKNKMLLILNKLKNILVLNQDDDVAEDYLFLSNQIEQILSKKNRKGLFRK